MKRFSEQMEVFLKWSGTVAGVMIFLYANFATITYVDGKVKEAKEQADAFKTHTAVTNQLLFESIKEVRQAISVIDQRTYDLNGREGAKPLPISVPALNPAPRVDTVAGERRGVAAETN